MKATRNSHKKEMTEREKSTGGRQSKRKNNCCFRQRHRDARAGQAGIQISESDGKRERDGQHQRESELILTERLISHMSKKLEALILPVHDSQGLSQVMGLQGGYLAGSVCGVL